MCIKRALAKLKVEADWQVPVERNAYEVAWFKAARAIVPNAVPDILAHDPSTGFFAMEYFDPNEFELWKSALLAGELKQTSPGVGAALAAIHSGTANDPKIEAAFQTDETFHAIRLEPYLEATAGMHPELSEASFDLSRRTATTKRTLVHGDVSPKNILVGPDGPDGGDAECAWYGDPAFDAAFCLNHLLLKAAWRPCDVAEYLGCYGAFAEEAP